MFLIDNEGFRSILVNAKRLRPREKIYTDPSYLTFAEFDIAGASPGIGRLIFLPFICRYNSCCCNFCRTLRKYASLWRTNAGYIANSINTGELRRQVLP